MKEPTLKGLDADEYSELSFSCSSAVLKVLDQLAEEQELVAQLRAEVREWMCDRCSTVYPGPPAAGTACVVCPNCNRGATAPRMSVELARAKGQIEIERQAKEGIRQSAIAAGCVEIEVCAGCGAPTAERDCGCPCGTAKRLVNARAEKAEATLKLYASQIMEHSALLESIGVSHASGEWRAPFYAADGTAEMLPIGEWIERRKRRAADAEWSRAAGRVRELEALVEGLEARVPGGEERG